MIPKENESNQPPDPQAHIVRLMVAIIVALVIALLFLVFGMGLIVLLPGPATKLSIADGFLSFGAKKSGEND